MSAAPDQETPFADRFKTYFEREGARQATQSLSNGAEIELRIQEEGEKPREIFCLLKSGDKNQIRSGPGDKPQVTMTLTPQAAADVLAYPSENPGEIGILFASLVASRDPRKKVSIQFNSGFLTLMSKGFVGVVLSGGKTFASHLASKGLGGMGAIKTVISKFGKK